MSHDNKATLRQFYDEVMGKGNLDRIDEFFTADFRDHSPSPGQAPGAAGVKAFLGALHGAMTGLQVSVDHLVAEGDTVAAHISITGTHTGELMGLPPSGNQAVMRVSDVIRFENGKAVERWGVEDMSGLMPQS